MRGHRSIKLVQTGTSKSTVVSGNRAAHAFSPFYSIVSDGQIGSVILLEQTSVDGVQENTQLAREAPE